MVRLWWLWLLLAVPALAGAAPFWFLDDHSQRLDLSELSRSSPSGLVCCTFWCSRCDSCRQAEPELTQLYQEMHDQVAVLAIDASLFDDLPSIRQYQRATHFPVPVLRDPVGGLADSLHIDLTTTTLIFDQHQSLRYFGRLDLARQALLQLLAGQPVTTPTTPLQGCPIFRPR